MKASSVTSVLLCFLSGALFAQEGAGDVVATVDGHSFERQELERKLFERLGRQFTEYVIDLFLYEQEAERRGLSLSDGELEAFVRLRMAELEASAGGAEPYRALLARQGSSFERERERIAEDARGLLLARKLVRAERVRDDALRAAFELRYGTLLAVRQILVRYEVPEDEDSVYVAMQCEKRVERLLGKLEAGADFGRLAEESSDDALTRAAGGQLGTVLVAELDPRFREALAGVPEGGWSEPIETGQGFHILFVESRQQARESFEAVAAELEAELLEPEVSNQEIEMLTARLRAAANIDWN